MYIYIYDTILLITHYHTLKRMPSLIGLLFGLSPKFSVEVHDPLESAELLDELEESLLCCFFSLPSPSFPPLPSPSWPLLQMSRWRRRRWASSGPHLWHLCGSLWLLSMVLLASLWLFGPLFGPLCGSLWLLYVALLASLWLSVTSLRGSLGLSVALCASL